MYNKREQKLITELVNYDFGTGENQKLKMFDSFIGEKIFNKENEIYAIIRPNDDSHIFYYKSENFNQSFYLLSEIFLLIKRLIDNKLIILIPIEHPCKYVSFFVGTRNYEIKDDKVYVGDDEYISRSDGIGRWLDKNGSTLYKNNSFTEEQIPINYLLGCWPVISPELKELVSNNFKTTQDKTLMWTRITAGISLFALFTTFILSFSTNTRIDSEQFERLINSINKDTIAETILSDTTINEVIDNECVNHIPIDENNL